MTKKDFQLIADVIVSAKLSSTKKQELAELFAARLATVNDRFDSERFIAACLVK